MEVGKEGTVVVRVKVGRNANSGKAARHQSVTVRKVLPYMSSVTSPPHI